jgi:UDP-2,3-diacylglucosamine pyrophosphatase LpxH
MGRLKDGTGWYPLEDFREDAEAAFDQLLDLMERERADELIINGDWIDFLQLEPFAYTVDLYTEAGRRLGWTEGESLQKLESCKAAHAHLSFFQKLRDFLRGGRKVTVMLGNHDPDLFWPKVQAELRDLLRPPREELLEFVRTHVRRGTAHIEHGNQHGSPENRFQDPLNIFHRCWSDGLERLEMVWGSIFVMEFFNELEQTHPYADKIKPTLSAVWLGLSNGWLDRALAAKFVKFLKGAGVPWRSLGEMLSDRGRDPKDIIRSIRDKKLARELLEIYNRDTGFREALRVELERTGTEEWASINTLGNDPPVTLDELTPTDEETSITLGLFRQDAEIRAAKRLLVQSKVEHVIFGHTHTEMDGAGPNAVIENYYNTGTWIRRLDLKKSENRQLMRTISKDDLKRDEIFESRIMTALVELGESGQTQVSLIQISS